MSFPADRELDLDYRSPDNLLRCIRRGADLNFLATLNSDDLQALIADAEHYALGPLLFQRVFRDYRAQSVNLTGMENRLREAYFQTLAQNMRAYHLLGQVLERFQTAGLQLLLLKGAYLAEQVYGDIGLRPMGDLDLLIPLNQFQRGMALFKEMGFSAEREYSAEVDGDLHFHAPGLIKDGVRIELHWDLVIKSGPVKIDIPGLWERARPNALENGSAWALSAEDLLLYLCVHAIYGHELYAQLRSLVDIAEVVNHSAGDFDWQAVVNTAGSWNAGRGVYLCFTLASELLGVDIPEPVLDSLKPEDWTPKALAWAKVRLFLRESELSSSFLTMMSPDLRPWMRFRALLHALFPPRAVMTRIYGYPPESWQVTLRYLPYAASRITSYWRPFMRGLGGDVPQAAERASTLSLQKWLGKKER